MSRVIPYREIAPLLPSIRARLKHIAEARQDKNWAVADAIRDALLSIDTGMKITVTKENKVTLWHWPDPPFGGHYHYANYGEFIANSEDL